MSAQGGLRVGVVGATSLLGKELAEELPESGLANARVLLLGEDEGTGGKLTQVGDEAAVVDALEDNSFEGLDFALFAGTAATTKEHWESARRAGAGIVDLSYALDGSAGVPLRAPALQRELGQRLGEPDLHTSAVVVAHPGAVMLATVASRLGRAFSVETLASTMLMPVSESGSAGMDELHQQTVSLLSFQTMPKEEFGAQVAFNLAVEFGEGAKAGTLAAVRERVLRHYGTLGGGALPELALDLVQAPVFHGLTASVFLQLRETVTTEQVRTALGGGALEVVEAGVAEAELPTNVQVAGQRQIAVSVRGPEARGAGRTFWLWMAADNLRLHASSAIQCALELRQLRPQGKVQ